jgi:hypothetical protein
MPSARWLEAAPFTRLVFFLVIFAFRKARGAPVVGRAFTRLPRWGRNFADPDDILNHSLSSELGERLVQDYRYLVYFRRGCHIRPSFPSEVQVT